MRSPPPQLMSSNSILVHLLILALSGIVCLIFLKIFMPVLSFAQSPCQTSALNEGLISATEGISGNTLFGNTEQVCITDTADASYREFKVPGYQDIEDQFYTFNRSLAKKTSAVPLNLAFTGNSSGNGIYLHNGDLTINTSSGNGAQIIFIRGNLNITGNIAYADTDSSSGLVFIVQGNINIYSTVTKVNSVLISSGVICTSYIDGSGCSDGTAFTQPLVVNGSLISLNKDPVGGNAIRFSRNLELNDQAAEVINKQAKYLYILRNGLFTRDLVITTEDQNYPIPTNSSYIPGLSVNGSCKPNPVLGTIPNTQTTWTFTGSVAGSGIYRYSWSGSDGLSGEIDNSPSIDKTYISSGTKTASLIITDLGNPLTPPSQPITCSVFIAIAINFIDIDPTRDIVGNAINNFIDIPGDNPTPSLTPTPTPTPLAYKRVFVTSETFSGDLGGIAGADAKCQAAANSVSLGGTWKAWISGATNSSSPDYRLTKSTLNYRRIDGVLVANNWTDLTDGILTNPINKTESGGSAPTSNVWTNTNNNGTTNSTSTGNSCDNWKGSNNGYTGATDLTDKWSKDGGSSRSCTGSNSFSLYCFEQ